jgi:hypothetical protein
LTSESVSTPSDAASPTEPPLEGPLNPAFIPEAALFVHHTLPLVCVALAHVLKLAHAKNAAPGERTQVSEAARSCVSSLIDALTSLSRAIEDTKKLSNDGSIALVSSGYEPSACASSLASTLAQGSRGENVLDNTSTGSVQGSASKSKMKAKSVAKANFAVDSGQESGLKASEKAASYLAEKVWARDKGFKEAANGAFQALAASYALSLEHLQAEIGERLAWLHKI